MFKNKLNEYKEAQIYQQNKDDRDAKDISLDFHSLKKKQNLIFNRRGSNVSITSQVTSQSRFGVPPGASNSSDIPQEDENEKQERLQRVKDLFKASLLGRVRILS